MQQINVVKVWTVVVVLCVFSVGCDSVPSIQPDDGVPAEITSFSFSPKVIDLSTLPAEQQTEESVTVPFSIEASVAAGDSPVASVSYILQGLETGDDPIVQGQLSADGATYRTAFDLILEKGALGNYSLVIFPIDEAGAIGNRVRGTVRFGSSVPVGSPPVIESVESDPEVVHPPTTFRLIATVTDPDGLSNILRVEGTAPNGSSFGLFDDGMSFGDDVADDGRFTASFDVPAASPGVQVFRIQAFDRSGLQSDVFEKEVTIQ